jgi:hypothetical protein
MDLTLTTGWWIKFCTLLTNWYASVSTTICFITFLIHRYNDRLLIHSYQHFLFKLQFEALALQLKITLTTGLQVIRRYDRKKKPGSCRQDMGLCSEQNTWFQFWNTNSHIKQHCPVFYVIIYLRSIWSHIQKHCPTVSYVMTYLRSK